jgi:CheY-like chemotaxis protein
MRARYRVALLGFNAVERGALGLCLQYTAGRDLGYEEASDAARADFLIVDAEADEDLAEQVRAEGRLRDTVFVGEHAVTGSLSQVRRPIDPDAIVQELDELLALRRAEASGLTVELGLPLDERMPAFDLLDDPQPLAGPSSVERAYADAPQPPAVEAASETAAAPAAKPPARPPTLRHMVRSSGDPSEAKAAARRASRMARLRDNPPPRRGAILPPDVLVLDDSEIARRYLCKLLGDFGFRAHAVADSAAAWSLLGEQAFAVAFLDIALGEDDETDGIELCARIKRAPPTAPAPVVMLVSGSGQPADEVRAKLAGCDAYLTKPVGRGSVAGALEACGVALPADARRL